MITSARGWGWVIEKTWVSTLHAHSRMLTRFFEKKKKDKKKKRLWAREVYTGPRMISKEYH